METEKSERIRALKEQGNVAFALGDFDGAIKLFSLGLELDSESYVLYSNRSASYAAIQVRSQ